MQLLARSPVWGLANGRAQKSFQESATCTSAAIQSHILTTFYSSNNNTYTKNNFRSCSRNSRWLPDLRKMATQALSGSRTEATTSDLSSIHGLQYWFERSRRYESLLVDHPETPSPAAATAAGASDIASTVIPVQVVSQSALAALTSSLAPHHRSWLTTARFKAAAGELCVLPAPEGGVARVLLGLGAVPVGGAGTSPWPYASLAKLPGGAIYRVEGPLGGGGGEEGKGVGTGRGESGEGGVYGTGLADRVALGFLLGHYVFDRYKRQGAPTRAVTEAAGAGAGAGGGEGQVEAAGESKPRLVWPEGCDRRLVLALASATVWARDLITTPAEDLGPQHLAAEAAALAGAHAGGAVAALLQGDQLLAAGYPAIHTVGRASYRPPLLVLLEWSPPGHPDPASLPLVALVGKGVCFDSGGLNIKTTPGMKLMKKDMGGAALVLSLAHIAMACGLRARLLVAVPAVENSVAGNAYRPLDVLNTRAGITVENGNTDAEGRLILSDALAEAASRHPDLLLDAATLTGAARTALGPDLPAIFLSDEGVWRQLEAAAKGEADPLWRLPLHAPYRKLLDSKVADLNSTGSAEGQGGAILAALFLKEFVKDVPRWVHVDTPAYIAPSSVGPGRPEGGEAQGLRALWALLATRYGTVHDGTTS